MLAILCVLERGCFGHECCPFFVFLRGGIWTQMLAILCVLERGFLDTNVAHSLCPIKCFEQVVQNPHRLIGKLWLRAFLFFVFFVLFFLWGGEPPDRKWSRTPPCLYY